MATWTKQVGASRFGYVGAPAFTADGKYAFAQYHDEQAGRYPYDGGDIHAELVWIEVASRRVHEAPIPARSRTDSESPARPGAPYALHGSTVVWQGLASPDANGQIPLMALDLSQRHPAPRALRTVRLPPRTPEQQAGVDTDHNYTGTVVGAGGGRVVIANKYGADRGILADRLFLVDRDGTVRDLGRRPTVYWANATFSPDGTRFAYETGTVAEPAVCQRHQVSVFDAATGQLADGFPPGPFDASPKPCFYGNTQSAVWWAPGGRLRATGSADRCPTNLSEPTPDAGVWELRGTGWAPIAPAGTYRLYPLSNGDTAVVAKVPRPPDQQCPDQPSTVTSLFLRTGGKQVHLADVEATGVAVPAT
ncbi:hypothetical protein [Mycobacterium talmoniae]|uniref:hypothetical protein n=1 Tax=Mycobacterium talmoniae TaxID=1858794 RepID=UPI0010583C3C|nr:MULTISPECIES: hypothetical protein [Mycobacterium]TDH50208.1 hypothetical protein E2F47_18695 [Mycobacterium eburneum]